MQRYPSEVARINTDLLGSRHAHVEEQKVVRAAALEKGGLKKGEGSGFMQDIRSVSM